MTQQIKDVLYELDDNWRNEDEVIVLTTYINSLEQRIAEYEFEMKCYIQCVEQLKACEAALEEAEQRIKELESSKTCEDMLHLYNELDTIKWWSAIEGDAWDSCIDAVRDCIKKDYL